MASCQKEKIDKDMLEGKMWELIEVWSLFNDSPTHEFYYTDFFPTVYFENGVGLSKVLDKSKNTITNECPFSYKYQGTRISFTEGLFSDVLWDVIKLTDDELYVDVHRVVTLPENLKEGTVVDSVNGFDIYSLGGGFWYYDKKGDPVFCYPYGDGAWADKSRWFLRAEK